MIINVLSRLNDVWMFDIDSLSWSCPYIRGKKPKERFGQSQVGNAVTCLILYDSCQSEEYNDIYDACY